MIHELLAEGRENARTGKELAQYFNCSMRDITEQVERERRAGQPICAATSEPYGYYLPANPDELADYCRQLWKRAGEIHKTRRALIKVLKEIRDKQEAAEHGKGEKGN